MNSLLLSVDYRKFMAVPFIVPPVHGTDPEDGKGAKGRRTAAFRRPDAGTRMPQTVSERARRARSASLLGAVEVKLHVVPHGPAVDGLRNAAVDVAEARVEVDEVRLAGEDHAIAVLVAGLLDEGAHEGRGVSLAALLGQDRKAEDRLPAPIGVVQRRVREHVVRDRALIGEYLCYS